MPATAPIRWPDKDPDEILDYGVDFSNWLGTDTISAIAVSLPTPAGVVKNSQSFTSTVVTVWLSGGNEGDIASILTRITTAGGRVKDQTCLLKIRSN